MPRVKQQPTRRSASSENAPIQSNSPTRRKSPSKQGTDESMVTMDEHDTMHTRTLKYAMSDIMWERFPLVLIGSLSLSSVMYGLSTLWTAGELASVSRHFEGWTVLAGLLGWRGIELALAWFGNYDSYDLVSLVTLSHFPPLYLLSSFYNVSVQTAATSLAIDALATYIPFRLLRPVSLAHRIKTGRNRIPDQIIITDPSIKAITVILASSLYSTVLYAAYKTFLPAALVTYFNDIPTVEAAHTATPISLIPMNLLIGLSAYSFIFSPAAALPPGKPSGFDPATATFAETLWYNVWGWNPKTKMIIKRTAALVAVTGINGWLQIWATIDGVESAGAAMYSSVFAAAGLITGVAYGFVCNV